MRSLNYAELYLVAGGEDGGDSCGGDCGSAPSDSGGGSLSASEVAATLGGFVNSDGVATVSITGHSQFSQDSIASLVGFGAAVVGGAVAGALRGAPAGLPGIALGALTGAGLAAITAGLPALATPVALRGLRGNLP